MPYTLAIIKTKDGAARKANFPSEQSVAVRKAAGEKSYTLLQDANDPNKFALLNEWSDAEKMREFMESDDLQKLQAESGVIELSEVIVCNNAEEGSI